MKKTIKAQQDIEHFERSLAELFLKQIEEIIPVTIEDSRQTDSVEEAVREQRISLEAFQALHGFNPNSKKEVLNQYEQGKIKKVAFNLPSVIFPHESKAPTGVNYLKVRVTASQSTDSEVQHLLSGKAISN